MSTPTTGAQDLSAALVAILNAYKAAHPTHLRKVYPTHPGTFSELPLAYVDIGDESLVHVQGTRTRHLVPTVTYVSTFSERDMDLQNAVRDGLTDAFTAGVRQVASMVIVQTQTARREETIANPSTGAASTYPTLVFTFDDIDLQEGRV